MKYSVDKAEHYSIISVGEDKLDATVAPELKSELLTMHAGGTRNVILDMSKVRYTDSSGLSSLLVGNRVFQEDNGMFILAGLTEHVMKLIKISQLDGVLEILPTVQESIDAVFLHTVENDLNNDTSSGDESSN
jgi:anti-anti-sigma factor